MIEEEKNNGENTGTQETQESFADLFDPAATEKKQLSPGQKIEAEIVGTSKEYIFLNVGGKSEGYIARDELLDEEGNLSHHVGDTIQVYFLSDAGNEMLFTTRVGASQVSQAHLQEAFRSGIPVAGSVEEEIKGGFKIKIAGSQRAFCPYSQMGLRRIEDTASYIEQQLSFKIIEFSENGRNIILSARAVQEEERRQQKKALQQTLREGMTVTGKVTSIRDFGAFVDIGGVDGLIPISEIGWGRIEDIHEFLTVGQGVEVLVLKLDWEKDRISLSMKRTLADPWENPAARYPVGSCHSGKVVRLAKFGAFVSLEPGIDGLLHISKLGGGQRINHPKEVLAEGAAIDIRIEGIDEEKKRISLALADSKEEETNPSDDYRQYLKAGKKPTAGGSGTLGALLQAKLREKERK